MNLFLTEVLTKHICSVSLRDVVHAQTITLPPPCFIIARKFWGLSSVLTLSHKKGQSSGPNKFIFTFSAKNRVLQISGVPFRWSRANCNLCLLFLALTKVFSRAILAFKFAFLKSKIDCGKSYLNPFWPSQLTLALLLLDISSLGITNHPLREFSEISSSICL